MSYAALYSFAVRYALQFGALFAVVSLAVSFASGGFTAQNTAIGFLIGAGIALCQLPRLIKAEVQTVYTALVRQWVLAVVARCDEQGVTLDLTGLHMEVLRATRKSLSDARLFTIDLDTELSKDGNNPK